MPKGSSYSCLPDDSLLDVNRVPLQYREPFIVCRYREPCSSAWQCLRSLLYPTNETVNFWSHFALLLLLLAYIIQTCPDCFSKEGHLVNPYCYPMLSGAVSIIAYHIMSCTAHVFCSMSPRVRHMCFFLDYGAISVYCMGGAIACSHYLNPQPTGFILFDSRPVLLTLTMATAVFGCVISCATRHRWAGSKYILRTIGYFLPFIASNSPTIYRGLACIFKLKECSRSLIPAANCYSLYFLAAFMNVARLPERRFPGWFDFFGQSHHWVHTLTSLGTFEIYRACLTEMIVRWPSPEEDVSHMSSSLLWMVATLCAVLLSVLYFGLQLTENGNLKSMSKKTVKVK